MTSKKLAIYSGLEDRDDKGRIYYFDNLKFLLILLVVIGHYVDPFSDTFPIYKSVYLFIYTFHMPLFVFSTGFFAKTAVKKDVGFQLGRVISFFILYAGLSYSIYFIEFYMDGRDVTYDLFSTGNSSWYLLACCLWYLMVPILGNIKPYFVIPVLVVIAIVAGYTEAIGDFLVFSRVLCFAPFFMAGYYMNDKTVLKITSVHWIVRVLALGVLAAVFYVLVKYQEFFLQFRGLLTARNSYAIFENPDDGALYRGIWFVSAVVLMYCFMLIVPKAKLFFTKLGENTLQTYIWHLIVLRLLGCISLVSIVAGWAEGSSLYSAFPFVLAIVVAVVFSLKPPFGYLVGFILKFKYNFLYRKKSS